MKQASTGIKKRLFFSLTLSAAVYTIMLTFFGPEDLLASLLKLPAGDLMTAAGFVTAGLLVEFVRWQYYLNKLDIRVSRSTSLRTYLAGHALSILPAKSGELIRCVLMKKEDVPYDKTIAIHFASVFTSFLALFMYTIPIMRILGVGSGILSISMISLAILFVVSIRYPGIYIKLLSTIEKRVSMKWVSHLRKLVENTFNLLRPKEVIVSLGLMLVMFFIDYLAFFKIAENFDMQIETFVAYSIYCLSVIIGSLSMVPGGVGIVEGGSAYLLSNYMDASASVLFVVVTRILLMWGPMLLGWIALNLEIMGKERNNDLLIR